MSELKLTPEKIVKALGKIEDDKGSAFYFDPSNIDDAVIDGRIDLNRFCSLLNELMAGNPD
mgnify:CR=1 FL=1